MYDGTDGRRPATTRSRLQQRQADDAALLRAFAADEGWRGDMRAMRDFVRQVRTDIGERGVIHRLGWKDDGAAMAWYSVDPEGAPAAAPAARPAAGDIPTTSDAAGRIPGTSEPVPLGDRQAETVAGTTGSAC